MLGATAITSSSCSSRPPFGIDSSKDKTSCAVAILQVASDAITIRLGASNHWDWFRELSGRELYVGSESVRIGQTVDRRDFQELAAPQLPRLYSLARRLIGD